MRIAIVGTGIAGNIAAWKLRDQHDITVFEAANYVGGHTNTVDVTENGQSLAVDTGFIVFNEHTYPNFIEMLDAIGQPSKPSNMSFSVHSDDGRIEYNSSSLNGLFSQRRSLFRPAHYRMIRDILRFFRNAVTDVTNFGSQLTVGEYLRSQDYSDEFINDYLIPMTAAIWSKEPVAVLDMPALFLVRFFKNHGLLQLKERPQWHVIEGGSREYVRRLTEGHKNRIRLNSPVQSITRSAHGVTIETAEAGTEHFDYVFVACHSDQALRLLADPSEAEESVLGSIPYQANEAILHTDTSVLPKHKRAWSSWNYTIPTDKRDHVAVSYNMNILQGLEAEKTYIVTLNDGGNIDPETVIRKVSYDHPVYTLETIAAQQRQKEINSGRTFYCGAYWRNGFHEDGVVSALNAVKHFEEALHHEELHLRRAS